MLREQPLNCLYFICC